MCFFFFSSRRRHTRWTGDWSSDVCSSDLGRRLGYPAARRVEKMESLLRVPDDRSEAELQPDILLPCQLGDGLFGAARLQPEKRLQLAVLEDAVLTFERSVGVDGARPRRLLAEVDAWLASD